MASISGNFQFPSDKGIPIRPQTSVTPKQESNPNDLVTLSGTASPSVAGLAAQMLGSNPDLKPADVKEILQSTSEGGVVNARAALEEAVARRVPTTLMMEDAHGVSAVGSPKASDEGLGLTGLNSLASVVSSGRFEGLNGSYGPGKGLFGLK